MHGMCEKLSKERTLKFGFKEKLLMQAQGKHGAIVRESLIMSKNHENDYLKGKHRMDSFMDALLSDRTDKIPDEHDWFAPLIGDWERRSQ